MTACKCSVALPHSTVGWSVVLDYDIDIYDKWSIRGGGGGGGVQQH